MTLPFLPNSVGLTYPDMAEPDTVDFEIIADAHLITGVVSGCAVTQRGAGANMSVDVAAGVGRIAGREVTVGSINKTITANASGNPRIDVVTVSTASVVTVTAGTPAANPETATPPAGQLVLGVVYVPNGETAITDADHISDKRIFVPAATYHDVTWYGATGVGSDDSAEIQAAADQAGVNGVVYFPAGIYGVEALALGSVTPLDGQVWRGDGNRVSVLRWITGTGADSMVGVSSVDDVTFIDLEFDGQSNTVGSAIEITGTSERIRIIDCYFHDFEAHSLAGQPGGADAAITFDYSLSTSVATPTAYDATTGAWTLTGHSLSDGDLVYFSAVGTTPDAWPGLVRTHIFWVVNATANTFYLAERRDGLPIIGGGSPLAGTFTLGRIPQTGGHRVTGCEFLDCGGGVHLQYVHDAIVANNHFRTSDHILMSFAVSAQGQVDTKSNNGGYPSNIVISGNTIRGAYGGVDAYTGGSGSAIHVSNCRGVTVSGNTVDDCGRGVIIGRNAHQATVVGNVITNANEGIRADLGIGRDDGTYGGHLAQGATISGNVVRDSRFVYEAHGDASAFSNDAFHRFTVTGHDWATDGSDNGTKIGWSAIGSSPTGDVADTRRTFYLKVIDANTIELYNESALSTQITGSGTLSGTWSIAEFEISSHGITTSYSPGCVIANNHIYNVAGRGIHTDSDCNVIIGNTLLNCWMDPRETTGTGKGSIQVVNAEDVTIAYNQIHSNRVDLGATVTWVVSPTNTWNKTAHGFSNDDRVRFLYGYTSGLDAERPNEFDTRTDYYVVNATANAFQLSLTVGGAAIGSGDTQVGTWLLERYAPGEDYGIAGSDTGQLRRVRVQDNYIDPKIPTAFDTEITNQMVTSSLALTDLTDVNTSTPTAGNVLRADGVDWESAVLSTEDLSDPLFVDVRWYGATGDGTTDDLTAINNAIAACPAGGVVFFPTPSGGSYKISGPILMKANVTLKGTHAPRWSYAGGPQCVIKGMDTFTGAALVNVVGPMDGGRIENLCLDAGLVTPASPHCLQLTGLCRDWQITDVDLTSSRNHGLNCTGSGANWPKGIRLSRVSAYNAGPTGTAHRGFSLNNVTDSILTDCLAVENKGPGFWLTDCHETTLSNCRAVFNELHGFHVLGAGSSTTSDSLGHITLLAPATDRNQGAGIHIQQRGLGPVQIIGARCRRDGEDTVTASGANSCGIKINGTSGADDTAPIDLIACTVTPGVDDGGAGTESPLYGVRVTNARRVRITGGEYWGVTNGYAESGTNDYVRASPGTAFFNGLRAAQAVDTPTAIMTGLVDLIDVNTATVTAGNVLRADGTDWESATLALADLSDVNTSTATAGNVLRADGTDWESATLALADLSDVNTSTATAGNVLRADGVDWESIVLDAADVSFVPYGELISTDVEGALQEIDNRLSVSFMERARTRLQLVEHWWNPQITTGQIGSHGWVFNNNSTSGAISTAGNRNRTLSTGADATGTIRLNLGQGTVAGAFVGSVEWQMIGLSAVSDGTNTYRFRFGLHDAVSGGDATDGVYFEYDHATHGDHNFRACSANNTVRTKTDTGVAFAGLFSGGEFLIVGNGTSFVYYINGTQVATITTNLPGSAREYGPEFEITKTVGTTARSVLLQRFSLDIEI